MKHKFRNILAEERTGYSSAMFFIFSDHMAPKEPPEGGG